MKFGIIWHVLFNFRLAANLGGKHTFEKPAWLQAVSTRKYWYPCVCVCVCVCVLCFQKRGRLHTKVAWYRTHQAEPVHAHVKASIHVRKTISYADVETCLIGAMYPAREAETLSDLAHRFRSDIRSLMVCAVHVCVCVCVCACVRACARVLFLLICRSV